MRLYCLLGCLTLTFLAHGLFGQTQHDRIRLNTGASITRQYTTGGSVALGHLVKLNTSGQVIETSTTDTSGVIGVAINSAASGLVIDVGLIGEMPVTVDGGCTAANFLTISASIAGNARCLTSPGMNQSLGASLTTLGSAGNITALFSAGNTGSGGGGGGSSNPTYSTLAFSATPAFNVVGTGPNTFKITLTGNVTSATLTNAVAGQQLEFDICQDGTGGRTFVFPTNVLGAPTIFAGANVCTRETFLYDGTNANFNAGGGTPAYTTVTFSATPAFTVSGNGANTFKITLTANVTSSTLTGAVAGQQIELDICQDGTGGRTFVFPTTVLGAPVISPTASACTRETFLFDGTNANFNVTAAQVSGTPVTNNCVKWAGTNLLSDAGAACGTGGTAPSYTTVSFSATPTFTVSGSGPNGFKITLTGNVTSSTLSGAVAGQPIEFDICQDATGARTFVFPANVLGAVPILSAASACIRETFMFDGTNANFNEAALLAADNTWVNPQRFKSGFPWHDVTAYGASGSNLSSITASITSTTTAMTLSAAGDFKNGQGLFLQGCNGNYATSIVSGGGTTALVVADAAPCTLTNQALFHDDQPAWQAALNDAAADTNPGLLFCPTGNYNIMRAPLLTQGHIEIVGASSRACKLLYPSQGNASFSNGFVSTTGTSGYVPSGAFAGCAALLTGTGGAFCINSFGTSFWFDLRDCDTCSNINGLAAFRAEVTFKLANLSSVQTLMASRGIRDSQTTAEAFELTVNTNGSLTCKLNVAGTLQSITGAASGITAAVTQHAALTYDNATGNFRCFANGNNVTGSPLATSGTISQQLYEEVIVDGLPVDFPDGGANQQLSVGSVVDSLRLTKNAGYTTNFTPPTAKFGGADANTLIQINWDKTPDVFTVGTTLAAQTPVYFNLHESCPGQVGTTIRNMSIGAGAYFAGGALRLDEVEIGGGSGSATVTNCSYPNQISQTNFGGTRYGLGSMSGLMDIYRVGQVSGSSAAYPFVFAPPSGTYDHIFVSPIQGVVYGAIFKLANSNSPNAIVNAMFIDNETTNTVFKANLLIDQMDSFIMNGGSLQTNGVGCTTNCWHVVVQETNHAATAQFNGTIFITPAAQDAIIHHVLNSNNLNPIVLNHTYKNQAGVRWTDQPGHAYWSEPLINTVTFSATPIFDCTKGALQKITLTGNVTSSTQIGCVPGQSVGIEITQDATGGRTFVAPAGSVNFPAVASGANAQTLFLGTFDGTNLIGPVAGGGGGTPCTITALSLQYNNGGSFGCTNATYTAATGVFNFAQLANGNSSRRIKRFTDSSPTGFFDEWRNAADTVTLASLGVLGDFLGNTYTANGTGAGALGLSQGATRTTADCPTGGPSCVLLQVPAAVTAHMLEVPGVPTTGVLRGVVSGSGVTLKETINYGLFPSIAEFPIGVCTSATAANSSWDTPASGTAGTAACITDGSNVHSKPALNFANSGTPEWWYTLLLPSDLAGTADMNLVWQTATVSGTATFNLDVICVNPNNAADTTAFSSGNFMAPAQQTASSTGNNLNLVQVTGQAWPASCTAGTFAHFRLKRTDTGTAVTASVVDLQVVIRGTRNF